MQNIEQQLPEPERAETASGEIENKPELAELKPEAVAEAARGQVSRFEHEGEQLVSQVAAGYGTEPDAEVRADLSRLSDALRGEQERLERSLGSAPAEERVPAVRLRERFGEILGPGELEGTIAEKISPILERALRMDGAVLARCEQLDPEALAQVDIDDPNKHELDRYLDLRRKGFGKAELRALYESAARGGGPEVARAYGELVNGERKAVAEYLEKNQVKERCRAGIEQLGALYEEAGVQPHRPELPTVQFMGTYELIALQLSYEQGTPEGIPYFLGDAIQLKNRDAIAVVLRNEMLGEGDETLPFGPDDLMHLTVHEIVHSGDCSEFRGGELNDFSMGEAHAFKGGFMSGNRANTRRQGVLLGLNEGTTELVTRVATSRIGYRRSEAAGPHGYDGYVADVAALVDVLEHRPANGSFDPARYGGQSLRSLLEMYQSKTGTLELGRKLQREIGPKALSIFEALSGGTFAKFVVQLQRFRSGEQPDPVEVFPDSLTPVGLKLEELQISYPFLTAKKVKELDWDNF